jgi:putative endonuclease
MRAYFVYIMASKKNGVLYTGVTNNLIRRVYEHRNGLLEGFTEKYFVKKLVYWEEYEYIERAIACEKCIKRWKRDWKIRLIKKMNPSWNDLFYSIGGRDSLPVIDEYYEELQKQK